MATEANLALNVTDQEGQTGGLTKENDITRDWGFPYKQKYGFDLKNMKTDVKYRFSIVNFTKPDSLYTCGMKPVLYSKVSCTETCILYLYHRVPQGRTQDFRKGVAGEKRPSFFSPLPLRNIFGPLSYWPT